MSKAKVLTGFDLKLLAIITMLIDHVGAVFYPNLIILRIIGRISFPIFAFLIAEGFFYTKNAKKYILRLFVFAIITEPIFDLAFFGSFYHPAYNNVLFTFAAAVLILYLVNTYSLFAPHYGVDSLRKIFFFALSLLALISTEYFATDYGLVGVLTVLSFYFLRDKKAICYTLVACLNIFLALILAGKYGFSFVSIIQSFAILFIPFILLYNGKRGRDLKYLFYLFYPVHLLIIGLMKHYF